MGVIQEFFNNREIAIGIWVIIGLDVILPTKPARKFIKTAIPILFCKKFVIFYIVFLSFLGLVLFALNWAGLWDLTLLKDTVFWVLFVELPLFAKAIEKADGGRFFSKLIRENVAIAVAIEFFVGDGSVIDISDGISGISIFGFRIDKSQLIRIGITTHLRP